MEKQIRVEKINDRDPEAVTELLNGGNGRTIVASADDVIHGGLCDAALDKEGIDGDIPLLAERNDPLPNRFAHCNRSYPLSSQYVKKEYPIPSCQSYPF